MAVDPSRIRDVPLFAELGDDERADIAAKLSERHVSAGDRLSTEGGPATSSSSSSRGRSTSRTATT